MEMGGRRGRMERDKIRIEQERRGEFGSERGKIRKRG